jgi:hypothetical protein
MGCPLVPRNGSPIACAVTAKSAGRASKLQDHCQLRGGGSEVQGRGELGGLAVSGRQPIPLSSISRSARPGCGRWHRLPGSGVVRRTLWSPFARAAAHVPSRRPSAHVRTPSPMPCCFGPRQIAQAGHGTAPWGVVAMVCWRWAGCRAHFPWARGWCKRSPLRGSANWLRARPVAGRLWGWPMAGAVWTWWLSSGSKTSRHTP